MRTRYHIASLLVALLLLGVRPALADGTENFDDETVNDNNVTNDIATFQATSGVVAINDLTRFSDPNSFRATTGNSFQVTFSTAVASVTFWFSAASTQTAQAFSDAGCSVAIAGATANSVVADSDADPDPFVTIDPASDDILCVRVASVTGNTFIDDFSWVEPVLPVELASFDATSSGDDVTLRWRTASETANAGFEVQQKVNDTFQKVGFVEGRGTTTQAQSYSYQLNGLVPGMHAFRLKQIDFDGSVHFSPVVETAVELPGAYFLSPAYPNPFNPQTQFTLTVAREQRVQVAVYDMLGRQVAVLHNGVLSANEARTFRFEGGNLQSGLYLIRATGQYFSAARQITLLK
jgi:hypothetical protein